MSNIPWRTRLAWEDILYDRNKEDSDGRSTFWTSPEDRCRNNERRRTALPVVDMTTEEKLNEIITLLRQVLPQIAILSEVFKAMNLDEKND